MGPVAARTGPGGVRKSAGPKMGAWKRVVAAGRSVSGLGRAQTVAGARGLGRNRAAKVFVRCFCKASLDCGGGEGEGV